MSINRFERVRNLVILFGSTMTVMAGATIAPALPQMKDVFATHADVDLWVKLVLTMPALFIALGSLIVGTLIDRYGRRPILIVSVVLYGLSGTSGFFLDSLFWILVGRAILGIAVAGIMTACTTLIGDYFKGSQLQRFMGLQAAFMGGGGVLFLVFGGLLADVGWRFPFLIYSFAFLILPGVFYFVAEPPRSENTDQVNQSSDRIPVPLVFLGFLYSLAFLSMVAFYMIPVQLPFYLKALGEESNSQIGFALATMTVVAAFFSSRYQVLKRRWSFQTLFAFLLASMGAGYGLIGMINSPDQVYWGLIVGGMGLGLLIPNLNVWLVSATKPAIRGRVVGGMTGAVFLGQFFSPVISEPIADHFTLAGAFELVGMAMGLAGIAFGIWAFVKRSQ